MITYKKNNDEDFFIDEETISYFVKVMNKNTQNIIKAALKDFEVNVLNPKLNTLEEKINSSTVVTTGL